MSASHQIRWRVVLAVLLVAVSVGSVRAEQASEPVAPTDLPRQSFALGSRSLSGGPGFHRFVLERSWTIGLLLIAGRSHLTVTSDNGLSILDMADAALPPSHSEPTRMERQFRTFWPNSLRLALMNEDAPLWALEAIDVDLEQWHCRNSRSDYWDWRRRYGPDDWPGNSASEFFSLGYIPPPK